MRKLEKERGKGRNDYPVRAMWNASIAMIIFGHAKYADLLRELSRNVQLRHVCGFESSKIPGSDNMSRFVTNLQHHQEEILAIFIKLSDRLYEEIADFGEHLAIDSKWVWSWANRRSGRESPDGRSETDAEWGMKEYRGKREDGAEWSKTLKCFGFKAHVVVDAKYELPVAFATTGANGSDVKTGKEMFKGIAKERPHIISRCNYLMADRAYDDTDFILWLKERGVKAVIGKREMWKGEREKEIPGYDGAFYYNERGEVFCYAKESGEKHTMKPAGYDKERDALRKRCPVSLYGATCSESDACPYCKNIRIRLDVNQRVFTQIDRTSYKWETLYKMRTAVERVNSRLDVSFGFEARRVRGKRKMDLLATLAFVVMDALAVCSIKEGRPKLIRSLIRAA
jgi:hypothetical protein